MIDPIQPTSAPCAPCHSCLASSSKRASLKTLASAALALGASLHNGIAVAADDVPRAGDWLVGMDDATARPLGPADLKVGEQQVIVLPYDPVEKRTRDGSRLNRILLIKLDPASVNADTAPRAAGGVLAYSAICTHSGCDVNSWRPEEKTLLCICHFSQFQPADGANVVAGPAPRSLASLSLKTDGDKLVLASGFSRPPGIAR